jgi:hypothetical protein
MNMAIETTQTHFLLTIPGFDSITVRKLVIEEDLPVIYDWFNRDYARFWGLQGKSPKELEDIYRSLTNREGYEVLIASFTSTGEKICLFECYNPAADILCRYYRVKVGDRGLHMHVAPLVRRTSGHTYCAFMAAFEYIFRDPAVQRIVGEPDIRNRSVAIRFLQLGFRFGRVVYLPHKTAQFVFLTRSRFSEIEVLPPPAKRRLPFWGIKVSYHMVIRRIARKLASLLRANA